MNDIPAQAAAVALERYPGRPEVAAEVERRAREAMTQARIRAARDGLTAATMGEALKSPDVREAEALAWLADSVAQDMPAAAPSTSRAAPRRVAPPPAAHGTETRADLRAAAVLIGDILARDADEGLSARVREEQAARQESREQRHARGWFLVAELVTMHARQHGWTDEMEAAAERAALIAAGDGSLPVREFPEGFTAPAESVLRWCELSDFNAWLLSRGVKPLTLPQAAEAPAHTPSASASPAARPEAVAVPAGAPETPAQRRERLRARANYWKGQGVRDWTERVAGEEGVTVGRIRQILGSAKPEEPTGGRKKPRQAATFCSGLMAPSGRTR